jgi:hypothetical protein
VLGYLSLGVETVSFNVSFLQCVEAAVVEPWVVDRRHPFCCLLYAIDNVRGEGDGNLFSSGEMVGLLDRHWFLIWFDHFVISCLLCSYGMSIQVTFHKIQCIYILHWFLAVMGIRITLPFDQVLLLFPPPINLIPQYGFNFIFFCTLNNLRGRLQKIGIMLFHLLL